jgi:hypothetical protein
LLLLLFLVVKGPSLILLLLPVAVVVCPRRRGEGLPPEDAVLAAIRLVDVGIIVVVSKRFVVVFVSLEVRLVSSSSSLSALIQTNKWIGRFCLAVETTKSTHKTPSSPVTATVMETILLLLLLLNNNVMMTPRRFFGLV